MRKKILLVLLMVLGLSLLVACKPTNGEDPEPNKETYYKLVLPAGVKSNQTDDTKVKKDTIVELTLTVPENHKIKTLTIYGINLADDVNDNKLSFKMTADLTVVYETELIQVGPVFYDYTIKMPSVWNLPEAEEVQIVEDAPDLLIIGIVVDTYEFFNYETLSGWEYLKVFNNTNERYNMKGHRLVLANPQIGQNYEDDDSKLGNASLVTGIIFTSYIDEDFFIEPLSTALLWIKPYYWTAGTGSEGKDKEYSTTLMQPEAFKQTVEDFREFWKIDSNVPVLKVNNQPFIATHPTYKDLGNYPMMGPGAGNPYTHMNTSLLRAFEIQKFDDQGGSATASNLNKSNEIPEETLNDPAALRDYMNDRKLYDRVAFDVMEVRDNGEVVDMYAEYTNARKYFKPVVRANFAGLVNTDTLSESQRAGIDKVSLLSASGPGNLSWPSVAELQFRPPKVGERIMQLQVPLRMYPLLDEYVMSEHLEIMRYVSQNITAYRFLDVVIKLTENPEDYLEEEFKWRLWEVYSEGRHSGAAPTSIKVINLTRPS